jgi:microcystin-dependent protein
MADFPVKISELDKSYGLSASPVNFLINQRNDSGNYETRTLPLSVITNYAKEEAKKMMSNFIEVGTIIPYAGKVIGQESIKGWLLCNGQQVRKKEYETLWNLIGETYGPSTEDLFTLPDFKGRIEMGYSHTEESYEPDFGNWLAGEKIYLGEGNNPNYSDRGVFSVQLKENHIQNHMHYIMPHKHKIFNYVNMADFNKRKEDNNYWYGPAGYNYYYWHAGGWIASPSVNWISTLGYSPTFENTERILFNLGNFSQGLIYSKNYDSILYNRLNYKAFDINWVNAVRKYAATHPIRTVLVYKKEFIDEIKNRKKFIPVKNPAYDSNMKISFSSSKQGGDVFHSNIQPCITTNFLIKY